MFWGRDCRVWAGALGFAAFLVRIWVGAAGDEGRARRVAACGSKGVRYVGLTGTALLIIICLPAVSVSVSVGVGVRVSWGLGAGGCLLWRSRWQTLVIRRSGLPCPRRGLLQGPGVRKPMLVNLRPSSGWTRPKLDWGRMRFSPDWAKPTS